MNGLALLGITFIIIAGFIIFSLQAYSELYWRLEKYGKRARVPYLMKRQYIMGRRKIRQKHAKDRQIILKRLYSSINKDSIQ